MCSESEGIDSEAGEGGTRGGGIKKRGARESAIVDTGSDKRCLARGLDLNGTQKCAQFQYSGLFTALP